MTAAQNARDNLIAEDIRLRRVIGGQQRLISATQNKLERKIRAAVVDIDPGGAATELGKQKRLKRLEVVVKKITKEHYDEHAKQSRTALLGVAKAESLAVTGAIEESI